MSRYIRKRKANSYERIFRFIMIIPCPQFLLMIKCINASTVPRYFNEAIRINSNYAIAHNNLGSLFHNSKRYEEAEKEYRKAIMINPNFAGLHYNLGKLLCNLKRYNEAEEEYREAMKLNPNFAEAHYSLGVLYSEIGKLDYAKKEILKARELYEKQGRNNEVKVCDNILKNLE